jgi:hypothetical protein
MFNAVLRIHEILVRIRGSILMDLDPAIFVSDPQDVLEKKQYPVTVKNSVADP